MRMTMPRVQTSDLPILPFLYRFSLVRVVMNVITTVFVLQVITVIVLEAVAARRKRQKQGKGFPHRQFDPVQVGENTLQLYGYGRDLYEAMLAAIDDAQESIYLETYIWKDDEVGQELKQHLAQKAAQGVDVYVIYDSFGNFVVPR